MLTVIGRAAAQRLPLRTAQFSIPRSQLISRVASHAFSTTQWAHLPAKAAASTTKTKKTAEKKKPAAKKPAAKKPAVKTAVPKKKAAPKAKKVAPKKKPAARKPKKVLSPEETKKATLRLLKKEALLQQQPRVGAHEAWPVYLSGQLKGSSPTAMTETMTKLSENFKNLSSYERQRLEETAQQNKLADDASYKAWVQQMTPQEVVKANIARARLRKIRNTPRTPAAIRDDRLPKQPSRSYICFFTARWASGEFAGKPLKEVSALLGKEWKSMPPSEKAPYEATAKADMERYERELQKVLGRSIRKRTTA